MDAWEQDKAYIQTNVIQYITMTPEDSKLSTKSLARIKNISYIMEILFTQLEKDSKQREQQIERKEKAYDYLKKYGVMTLRESLEDLKNVITKIPIVDAK